MAGSIDEREQREALLAIYAIERQDDQSVMTGRLALLAAAIALLGAVGFTLLRSGKTPGWAFALLPLEPLPLLGLTTLLLSSGELRHRFIAGLEEKLAELIKVEVDGAPVPSFHRAAHGIWRDPLRALVAFASVFGSLLFLYIVLIVEAVRKATAADEEKLALGVAATCGLIALLLIGLLLDQELRPDHSWETRLAAISQITRTRRRSRRTRLRRTRRSNPTRRRPTS
jgi:hypothetical protein